MKKKEISQKFKDFIQEKIRRTLNQTKEKKETNKKTK